MRRRPMNIDELIERITDGVIADMKSRGAIPGGQTAPRLGVAGPGDTPSSKPAGKMDEKVARVSSASVSLASAAPASTCAGRVLVVVAEGGAALLSALGQASELRSPGVSVACLLSKEARATGGENAVTEALGQVSLLGDDDAAIAVSCADIVVVPVLPLHVAARVALLTGDDAVTKAILGAVLEGKRVYAATDFVLPDSTGLVGASGPQHAPATGGPTQQRRHAFSLRRQADEYLKKLREYGIILVEAESLAHEIERGLRVMGFAPRGVSERPAEVQSPATNARAGQDALGPGAAGTGADAVDSACSRLFGECSGCGKCIQENPVGTSKIVEAGASRIGAAPGVGAVARDVGAMIDHTLLKPDATKDQVVKLCEEAKQYGFASVCVNPTHVSLASSLLKGTPVKVCTVIGFPLGATTPTAKAIETRDAIANGADEVDMVINVGALKSGDYDLVKRDIEAVVEAARGRALVKVILETALLTDEEKVKACLLAKIAGADFVKTSTGFGPGGATVDDVRLMRKVVGADMGVKASGGIRDLESARKMIEAGASRIGASASVAIVKGQ